MSHCYEVTRYAVSVMGSLVGILVAFHDNLIFSYSHILIVNKSHILIFSLFKQSSYSHILIVQRKLIFSYSHCSKKAHILIFSLFKRKLIFSYSHCSKKAHILIFSLFKRKLIISLCQKRVASSTRRPEKGATYLHMPLRQTLPPASRPAKTRMSLWSKRLIRASALAQ